MSILFLLFAVLACISPIFALVQSVFLLSKMAIASLFFLCLPFVFPALAWFAAVETLSYINV